MRYLYSLIKFSIQSEVSVFSNQNEVSVFSNQNWVSVFSNQYEGYLYYLYNMKDICIL